MTYNKHMHKSQTTLMSELDQAAKEVSVGGIYGQYKRPQETYEVLHHAVTEADDSICVVYQAQYGEGLIFTRPLESWLDKVEWEDKLVDRFALKK
jgi:hypothetical protein